MILDLLIIARCKVYCCCSVWYSTAEI